MQETPHFSFLKIPFFIFQEKAYLWSTVVASKILVSHRLMVNFIKAKGRPEMFKEMDSCGNLTYNVSEEGFYFIFNNMLSSEERSGLMENNGNSANSANDSVIAG